MSSVSDLRQFRLEKKKIPSSTVLSHTLEKEVGRKRIQKLVDSDSDNDDVGNTSIEKKAKLELSVKEKEQRFLAMLKISQDYDTMDIQDSLVRCNWDVSSATRYLKDHFPKKIMRRSHFAPASQSDNTNGVHNNSRLPHKVQSKKNRKKRSSSGSAEESENGGADVRIRDKVYDSESDSDTEVTSSMTTQRKSVLEFLNKATLAELLTVNKCSEKKAAIVIELRPFTNWIDIKEKFENSKLNANILNMCQDLLAKQNNVANIMSKCNKMVCNLEKAVANGAGITEQPKLLDKELKLADYQIIGLNWLAVMHKEKMNGILADEMGLGKTIQVIAFLAHLKENNMAKGAHLIVVPSSTLDNWALELAKWCPILKVIKYHGAQDERRAMRYQFAKEGFKGFDILLTTYHMVQSTPEERKMFRICKLHYVIFDEAHMLKNMTTQRYQQLITINAEMRILLTGTPLQNNLLELMSLLCFVMPSFFGRSTEDIKSLFGKRIKNADEGDSSFERVQVDRAKKLMKPFFLRRVKKDVLKNLPKKSEIVQKIPMTPIQKIRYSELCQSFRNDKGEIRGTRETAGCAIMMDMRKLGNHPLLMRYYYTDDDLRKLSGRLARTSTYKTDNSEYVFQDIAWMSDFQVYQICQKHGLLDVKIPNEIIVSSGKFAELDKLLPQLKSNNHRVLLFSQFTMMLDIVEQYLQIRDHRYLRLDGQTNVIDRQELIDEYNNDNDIFIFLLSTKAGGMGINLTAADTVIIHDIDFNPYNDKQAEDRCHRMGQTKPVTIYRFLSEGTIEEAMHVIGNEKLDLGKEISKQNNDSDNKVDHKCMVRLLTMVLGMDEKRAEVLLSPSAVKENRRNIDRDSELVEF